MKTESNIPFKIYLDEAELPTAWYNVRADMKNKPAPLLNPGTLNPMTGTGYFDMVAYEKFHDGKMTDSIPTDADLQKGFDGIPRFPGNEI